MSAIIFLLLMFNPSHVTYNWTHVPGSISINYTGIKKVIINETADFLSNEWMDRVNHYYNEGELTYGQYISSINHLERIIVESNSRGLWWERDWWHSLSPEKGGIHHTKYYTVGRTGDIIDLGIAHVNQDFKFKLKEYKKTITNEWIFKFKPHCTLSTSKWIKEATCAFEFTYLRKGIKRFRFNLIIGYKRDIKEFIQLTVEMLNI